MLLAMALTAKTAVDRHFEVMDSANTITSPENPRRPAELKGVLGVERWRSSKRGRP